MGEYASIAAWAAAEEEEGITILIVCCRSGAMCTTMSSASKTCRDCWIARKCRPTSSTAPESSSSIKGHNLVLQRDSATRVPLVTAVYKTLTATALLLARPMLQFVKLLVIVEDSAWWSQTAASPCYQAWRKPPPPSSLTWRKNKKKNHLGFKKKKKKKKKKDLILLHLMTCGFLRPKPHQLELAAMEALVAAYAGQPSPPQLGPPWCLRSLGAVAFQCLQLLQNRYSSLSQCLLPWSEEKASLTDLPFARSSSSSSFPSWSSNSASLLQQRHL